MRTKKVKTPAKVKPGCSKASAEQRKLLFIDFYLSNGENAGKAALAAGYSPKTAPSQASRLLKQPKIQQEIAKRRAVVLDAVQLTTERLYREIARLSFADPRKFYNADGTLKAVHELDDDCAAVISSIDVDEIKVGDVILGVTKRLKQWDKNAALDKAAKILGSYEKDRQQPLAELAAAVDKMTSLAAAQAKFAKVLGK